VTAHGLEFFDRAHAAFRAACRSASPADFHYVVAGQRARLSFASPSMAGPLTGALAHLQTREAATSDLSICLWDGESTGVAPPSPPWSGNDYAGNGEILGFAEGRVLAAFDSWLGMLSLYDRERRLGLVWLRDARAVPVTLVGTPLRVMWQWWAAHEGGQLIHAAAVGTPDGAVIIAGASGAGKSTTALIALRSGLQYVGDDFVLVQTDPRPVVHSVYNSAKLDDRTLATRFPELRPAVHGRDRLANEKHLVFVHQHWPERMAVTLPLRALLLAVVTGRTLTAIVPVRDADAMRTLLPGLFPFPGSRRQAVERLAHLVRALPAYRLELGTDARGVEGAIRSIAQGALP
jgi:hypothetical protein